MSLNNKKLNFGAKKIDRIVTGFIIGGALASIFGLTHTKKGQEISKEVRLRFSPSIKKAGSGFKFVFGKSLGLFGKTLAFFVGIFNKK